MSSPTLEDRLRLLDDLEPIRRRTTAPPARRTHRREIVGAVALAIVLGGGILAVVIRAPDRQAATAVPSTPPPETVQATTTSPEQSPAEIIAATFPALPPGRPFDDPHLIRMFRDIHPTLPAADLRLGLTSFYAGTFNDIGFFVIVTPSGRVCLIGNLGPSKTHFIGTHCAMVADAIDPRKTMVGKAGNMLYMLAVPGVKAATLHSRGRQYQADIYGSFIYGDAADEFFTDSYTITLTDGTSYTRSTSGPA